MQVVSGPRQVGKTTLVRQVLEDWGDRAIYRSADEPELRGRAWITAQWTAARQTAQRHTQGAVLALDEIHKTPQWSETVKQLWDEDEVSGTPLHVVLLGSAPLLLNRGLSESLAGRFELIPLQHWSLPEMRTVFGTALEDFIYHGSYPGAAPLIAEPDRWRRYISDSLVETTISRDVLLLTRVDKPALLRRLFDLSCRYSGQILSYTKMLGQLQDAGNTTTLAHYLDLLRAAGMVRGIGKYSGSTVRRRASSPKLQVLNNALMTVAHGLTSAEARADSTHWGRLTESAVGAHLANAAEDGRIELHYWRDGNKEVDFVISRGPHVLGLKVKSGSAGGSTAGLEAFAKAYPNAGALLVGTGGVDLDEFLGTDPADWLS